MRRLLLIAVLLIPSLAFATFGASSAWDVQTTGADTNGGAYDSGVGSPGTDESMGSGTAITCTLASTTTATCSPAISSTTHGPGNFIHIASGTGCTTGWFEVLSQSAGTATLDHAMGSATNVCVGVIGGSLLTIGQANTNHVAGNSIYIQSGTYTITTAISLSVNTAILGYHTTHGDLVGTPYATWSVQNPLVTSATNSVNIFSPSSNGEYLFENISMSSTAGTRGNGINVSGASADVTAIDLILDGFAIAMNGSNRFNNLWMVNSEIKNWTNYGIQNANTGGTANLYISYSWIHDAASGTNNAVDLSGGPNSLDIDHSIISGSKGIGVHMGSNPGLNVVTNSTIANNQGDNISLGTNGSLVVANSILYGSVTGYGINGNSSGASYLYGMTFYGNAYGGNFSGSVNTGNGMTTGINPVTLSASPFVSSTNFALNSTAGGGAACKAAVSPSIFPGGLTQGYQDIGAVQSQGSGSGSSAPYGYVR